VLDTREKESPRPKEEALAKKNRRHATAVLSFYSTTSLSFLSVPADIPADFIFLGFGQAGFFGLGNLSIVRLTKPRFSCAFSLMRSILGSPSWDVATLRRWMFLVLAGRAQD
jgi:hypothetical protein